MLPPTFSPHIQQEFLRWDKKLVETPFAGNDLISTHEILHAHFHLIDFFDKNPHLIKDGKGVGGVGPRDLHLLESACSRQYLTFGNYSNIFEYAATLFFGLIKNHPFHDANKRTALLVLLYQLYKNNIGLNLSEQDLEDLAVNVADNQLELYSKYRELTGFDREIQFCHIILSAIK